MAFKIAPNPTFKGKVHIHVPGEAKPAVITFVFKHKTRAQLDEFQAWAKGKPDEDVIQEIAEGWDVEGLEFDRDGLTTLCQNHHSAPERIVQAYWSELTGARLGN